MLGVRALCRGRLGIDAPLWRLGSPPPQGSSLETGLCCPSPSSLNRPHPAPLAGTARLRRMAAYTRCLRCAGAHSATREWFRAFASAPSRHAVLYGRGEPVGCICPVPSPTAQAFAECGTARHSQVAIIRFRWCPFSRFHRFALRCGLSSCSPPLALTGCYPANQGFYSRASDGLVTLPPPGITTVATGQVSPVGLSPTGTSVSGPLAAFPPGAPSLLRRPSGRVEIATDEPQEPRVADSRCQSFHQQVVPCWAHKQKGRSPFGGSGPE
jgi:hypothetical protein